MMSRTERVRTSSLRGCFLTVFLSVWMDLTGGIDIQLIPQYPAVGQTVTLSVNGITGSLRQVTWYKGSSTDSSNQIFNYFLTNPPTLTNGPQYFSRAKALTNGSLQISQLTKEDHGNYTVQIQTEARLQLSVYLPVYERVTLPVVKPSINQPVENQPALLTCETTNAERIRWEKDQGSLPSGAILLSNNRSLNFPRISLSDAGSYRCEAVNPVSNRMSDPYTLTVCYDPAPFAAATAGIVCGTILGIVLIISASFLLYKRYILPVRQGHKGPSTERQMAVTVYDNVMHNTMGNVARDESSYMDLQFQSQDTYRPLFTVRMLSNLASVAVIQLWPSIQSLMLNRNSENTKIAYSIAWHI
ncbi:cell adhesion molecule CEACAM7-like [Discoglossus pictus]